MLTKRLQFCVALSLLMASCASLAADQGWIRTVRYPADARSTQLFRLDIDSSGRIFSAGRTYAWTDGWSSYDFLNVSVWANDGSPNTTFGGGIVKTSVAARGYDDHAYTCVLQPDGKLLSAGSIYRQVRQSYDINLAVVRHKPDGTLDEAFNPVKKTYGIVTSDFGNDERVTDILLQPDGKIVAITRPGFLMVRYTEDGKIDSSYGSSGSAKIVFSGPLNAHASRAVHHDVTEADSGIIVGGEASYESAGFAFALARLDATGKLDASFGDNGCVLWRQLGAYGCTFQDMATDAFGRIVVVGSSSYGSGTRTQMIVARFLANGSVDTTFGDGGCRTFPGDRFQSVDIQLDGKIVTTGSVSYVGDVVLPTLVFARFNDDGSPDETFGEGGTGWIIFHDLGTANVYDVKAHVWENLGEILAVGDIRYPTNEIPSAVGLIMKLLPNGTLGAP